MISQRHILLLLNCLAVLVTVLAVLGAFVGLAGAIDDAGSSLALKWASGGVTVLLAANVILLVAALAVREIQRHSPAPNVQQEPREPLETVGEESREGDAEIDLERERRLGG